MAIDTSLFGRLRRLFSTDVIIRNVGGNQLRTIDVDRLQTYGNIQTNSLIDRFNRIHAGNSRLAYTPLMNYQTLRTSLYTDYEAMDTDAIVASALDIIADEATLKNEQGEVLHIKSSNAKLQRVLYNLFYEVLNVEFNLWAWIRTMCKYGDFYLHLDIAEKFGVYNVMPFSVYDVQREEGSNPANPSYVRFKINLNQAYGYATNTNRDDYFENYEIAHFRLLSDPSYLPYGRSYLEPGRKIFKQLNLMEDAMLIHRIMRAPEKRIFYTNIGNIAPQEVDPYMEKMKQRIKKVPYVDPQTGDYNLKYNMMNLTEDFYIPLRGNDSTTKIDTLKGLEYTAIEDVAYLRDKLFAALRVPKAFMGYEKDLTGKATLASEDIRFARTVERIQRIALSELYKIALVHLYTQGYEDETLTNFEIGLTTPSIIYEQEKIALWKEKIQLAKDIQDSKLMPSDWIYDNIFEFSEDQYDEYRDLLLEDMKRNFRMGQIENEGNDPAKTGKSYGTPHDLATLYGVGRNGVGKLEVPPGYDETRPVGRPPEKASIVGTQKDPLGKDRLGSKENGQIYTANSSEESGTPKGGSPLALAEFRKNMNLFKEIPFGKNKTEQGFSLLNEENIKGIE
jgi:hypothetical protein